MNKNVIIVLGGALAVALVVALLVQVSLGGKKQVASNEPKVEILVATKDLAAGQSLKDADMRWQEWPQASVFPGAVLREKNQDAGKALTGRLVRSVSKGEPIVKSAMITQEKGNFVAGSLEPGMRAVAIETKAATSVGGFVSPGDRVDVVLTYKTSFSPDDDDPRVKNMVEQNIQRMASETILQNLKVLAVDQTAKPSVDDAKIKVGKTVTLQMTSEDSEKIALAGQMGDLTLALRGVGDNKIVAKDWKTVSDARLVTIDDDIFTEYRKMKKGGNNGDSVRIYNGSSVSTLPSE